MMLLITVATNNTIGVSSLLNPCTANRASDSLWPHGLQHARLLCSPLFPRVCSNSCPLSQWCYLTTSSSVVPFSFCLQSFPASGSFPMSQLFTSDGQSIGASASATVLPMNIQGWFLLGLTVLISLQFKGLCLISSYGQIKAQTTWMLGTCLKSNWFRIPGIKQRFYHCTLFIKSQFLETGDLITFTVISNYKSSICSPRQIWILKAMLTFWLISSSIQKECSEYLFIHTYT